MSWSGLFLILTNLEVGITGVDGSANKVLVLGDPLFVFGPLLVCADQRSGPRPEVVVADELTKRAITAGDDTDDLIGFFPSQACSTGRFGTEDGDKTGIFEELNLAVRDDVAAVTNGFVLVEKLRDLFGASKDFSWSDGVLVESRVLHDLGIRLNAGGAFHSGVAGVKLARSGGRGGGSHGYRKCRISR